VDPRAEVKGKKTLAEAIAYSTPHMEDTKNTIDDGAKVLTSWAVGRMTWEDLSAVPETSVAKVMKDSEAERGKRLCGRGSIVEIFTDKLDGSKVFRGQLSTEGKLLAFLAVGDSGEIVEGSAARVCGIVTGRFSYANSGGGTSHAVRVVGMFDLPANHKPAAK
jgi:hypothetical protein